MATTPNFTSTPKASVATISTANTNRDGTGTIVSVFTAGSSGSRIDQIIVQATATTTAGLVDLYLHDGTNAHLIREIAVTAITPSTTTAAFNATLSSQTNPDFLPLFLQSGWSLRAAPQKAESFRVFAEGGDF